ncbi:MAG: acyltransferase, partial [Verrucomicrobiota bacterium]
TGQGFSSSYVAVFMRRCIGTTIADRLVLLTIHLRVGVPFFFVISGYCIATVADKHRQRAHRIRDYFFRRMRRIYPPFWICLGLCASAIVMVEWIMPGILTEKPCLMMHPANLHWQQWFGNLTLTETWRAEVWGPPANMGILETMWTLCYEEQFYLVVGLLVAFFPRYFFHGVCIVTTFVYLINWQLHPHIFGLDRLTTQISALQLPSKGFFWDGHWLDFSIGVGVYYWTNHASRLGKIVLPIVFLVALAPVMFPIQQLLYSLSYVQKNRLAAVSFGLILICLYRFDASIARSILVRPITRCGVMCYSIYLVHLPITCLLSSKLFHAGVTGSVETLIITIPICMIISVAVAWVFFISVERRFINSVKN